MGYFSNGSEGAHYEERYCKRCLFGGGGCAVWSLHMLWNYEQCEPKGGDVEHRSCQVALAKAKADALAFFIPSERKGLANGLCEMFVQNPARAPLLHSARGHGHCPFCVTDVHMRTYRLGDGTVQICPRCNGTWTIDRGGVRILEQGEAPNAPPQEKPASDD